MDIGFRRDDDGASDIPHLAPPPITRDEGA